MGKIYNNYYVCLNHNQEIIPLRKIVIDQKFKLDYNLDYFRKIFEVMEEKLEEGGLTFYLTRDVHTLPSYGKHVVAVVLGDEWCRIPRYFHKVRAVFKCYGTEPILGCNFLLQPSWLNFLTLIQFLRISFLRIPSYLYYVFHKFKNMQSDTASITAMYDIPLGYYKQEELPIKYFKDRLYDTSFIGSIKKNELHPVWSFRYWIESPKNLSRKKLIASLSAIKEKYFRMKIELSITPYFPQAPNGADAGNYSEKMMATKICLAPRGTSFETFRFFEGLRYGCIVVTEALPSRWFYDGSPAIQVKDWRELEKVIEDLISDQHLMQEIHKASLNWWKTKCSEEAVGAYFSEKLNLLKNAL